jgi:hypothetical protein
VSRHRDMTTTTPRLDQYELLRKVLSSRVMGIDYRSTDRLSKSDSRSAEHGPFPTSETPDSRTAADAPGTPPSVLVTISGILGIPLVNLIGSEIRFALF